MDALIKPYFFLVETFFFFGISANQIYLTSPETTIQVKLLKKNSALNFKGDTGEFNTKSLEK